MSEVLAPVQVLVGSSDQVGALAPAKRGLYRRVIVGPNEYVYKRTRQRATIICDGEILTDVALSSGHLLPFVLRRGLHFQAEGEPWSLTRRRFGMRISNRDIDIMRHGEPYGRIRTQSYRRYQVSTPSGHMLSRADSAELKVEPGLERVEQAVMILIGLEGLAYTSSLFYWLLNSA